MLNFEPILPRDYEQRLAVLKQGLHSYVDEVFGWNDDFQLARLETEYQADWFFWVMKKGERVGMVCYKPYDKALHVHLLLVFPKFQNQGVGAEIMSIIHEQARSNQCEKVTLSSFIANTKAIRFYEMLGYVVLEAEPHFVNMVLDLTPSVNVKGLNHDSDLRN
ncbi:GNAT family N-acetyltransferase [Vibrio sp. T187]|uniref:GNAT family N-acetyltransferase n=1 Tax=Vibrio TaxID=662 RepID=UPI0010C9762A|nr:MULTISPECIES: GNAT family N-acetyltransferase [Vibrio]MBW3695179.1 GNAT family N-acetyltransferase [Vibrio sp. T187]